MECIFCNDIKNENILLKTTSFIIVFDIDPIQNGHLLIISKKHYENILDIPDSELHELLTLEKEIVKIFENKFDVLGVSIIQNNGKIMDEGTHFHLHIVPRYSLDNFWENQIVKQKQINSELLRNSLSKIQLY